MECECREAESVSPSGCSGHHPRTEITSCSLAVWKIRAPGPFAPMIRTILMLSFWAVMLPIAALFCFPWVVISGDVLPLYRVAMWGAGVGVRLAGVRARVLGLQKLDPARTYVFMSNHV